MAAIFLHLQSFFEPIQACFEPIQATVKKCHTIELAIQPSSSYTKTWLSSHQAFIADTWLSSHQAFIADTWLSSHQAFYSRSMAIQPSNFEHRFFLQAQVCTHHWDFAHSLTFCGSIPSASFCRDSSIIFSTFFPGLHTI